jgi:DNA-binding beta-propeller fold protein YncE
MMAGCGGQARSRLPPPAAQPARSPAPPAAPAGTVVRVGRDAEGVAADSLTGIVAVGVRHPDGIVLLNGATGTVTDRVDVPAPRHLALAAPGGPLLDPAEHANRLIEIALTTGDVLARIHVGKFPHAALAVGGHIYVVNQISHSLTVLAGVLPVQTIPLPLQPDDVTESDGRLAIVDARTRELLVYDLSTLTLVATLPAGVGPTHEVAAPNGLDYVLDTTGGQLEAYSLDNQPALQMTVPIGGRPYGIALDARRGVLWVTDTASDRLLGFHLNALSPRPFVSLPTVRQPNSVAVDEATGRVFVAGRSDGELELIDPPDRTRAP